jgi:arylsulfatase A-like enzyme
MFAIRYSLLLCALSTLSGFALAAEPSKPNIILFLVDDMGWMDSEPYGSQYYETPNMTRLAAQSMRFSDAYALPLCSPTRGSLLTGQHSSRHGITSASGHTPPAEARLPESAPPSQPLLMPQSKTYLDPSHHTLAEALLEGGYRTGHFGKWHLGLTEPHWPEKHGFEVSWTAQPSPGPPGSYFSPWGVLPPGTEAPTVRGQRAFHGTVTDGPPGEYIVDRVTDEALKFIEQVHRKNQEPATKNQEPFFLNLWQYGVHGPWEAKEEYIAHFAKKTDPTGRQDNPIMAAMLKSVDDSLGRVLDKLDELQLADNTVVIFYSDNGGNTHSMTETDARNRRADATNSAVATYRKWAGYKAPTQNNPLRQGKGRLYEGGTRVPLIVRWPGKIAPGSTSDAIVGCIDMYPTILDAVGIKPAEKQIIDGESFLPVLTQTGGFSRDTYFTWFPHLVPGVSVRRGDWKLIRRFTERPGDFEGLHELFNLKNDIGESTNLAAKMPEKVKELDALIDAFVQDTGALYPQPNPAYTPRPAPANSAGKAAARDPAQGLVPRLGKLTLIEDAARLEGTGPRPFLGTARVKLQGPLTLHLRTRSQSGGPGKVQWRTADQETFPETGQLLDFTLPAGDDWQDTRIELPIQGTTAGFRIFLPAIAAPVELQTIRFTAANGKEHTWDFRQAKP